MEGVLNTLGSDFVSSQFGKKISFHFVQFFRQALDARVGADKFLAAPSSRLVKDNLKDKTCGHFVRARAHPKQ